ncbi:GNAT family N-acetyltransferase [Paenibacillus glycinis]|uniref:GNAT family N-acetyltransferase n=1 Tax=Paenibacillus glycinis TaxID=2697035 RepID=A0ABW9XR87_9BACL|nr:GNAT family N-acetyltransferase [Paenibacillus glycinis]NBD25159.1 GNAT family N-acetyltransferase [Paenibacillus glycinis]
MFIVNRLDAAGSAPYESLTFQYARPLLRGLDQAGGTIAVGAEWTEGNMKEAAGLLVINVREAAAEVVSVFVAAKFRRRGIGSALFHRAEAILRGMGIAKLSFVYYSGKAITPALEAFLNRGGWSEPIMDGKVYKTDARIAEASWIRKTAMPAGMRSFYWHELSGEEKDRLAKLEGSLYPAFLSPFKTRLTLEESNSLGLRIRGKTVGWCMTYRIAGDTLLYDSVYIAPEYRLSGVAFMLVAQSVLIQLERNIPNAIFAVNRESPFMRKMLDRWLAPYATGISERNIAYKDLSASGG